MKEFCFDLVLMGLNHGIMMGIAGAVVLALYPLLKKLMPPQVRCYLWALFFSVLLVDRNFRPLLPVTLEDLVSTRGDIMASYPPAFLPSEYRGEGGYHAALPGGALVRFELHDWMLWLLFALWLAGVALFQVLFLRKKREIRALVDRSRCLEGDDPLLQCGRGREIDANVWLCSGLPTSFVYRTPMTWGEVGTAQTSYQIFLQEELSDQRQKLVLLHELGHIDLGHCWWKGLAAFTLVLNWWNPVAWPIYFLLCRDLELACDRSVMKRLDEDERREYARTLVELGAGKQMWDAPLAFGECDGALRVKAIANWTPRKWWVYIPATLLALVLAQFLWMGGHYKLPPPQDMPLAWERETGSADNFALDLGREMGQKIHHARDELAPDDPRVLDVREVWEGPEEYPWQILWVLDGEGNWYRTESAWWGMSSSWAGVRSAEPMDAPDLTGSDLIYGR